MDGLDSLVEFVVSTSPNHCAVVGGRKTTGYSKDFYGIMLQAIKSKLRDFGERNTSSMIRSVLLILFGK
jgi:hypothetical protein